MPLSQGIQAIGQQLLAEVQKHQQQHLAKRLRDEGQLEFDFVKDLDKQESKPLFITGIGLYISSFLSTPLFHFIIFLLPCLSP